ncbi:MAG: hypothetical protein WDW36_002662 [Sanguina aurantia]
MPGGADLPYCRLLNGQGNNMITEYVKGGGSYLGLCAGAYYGCSSVEFEPGSSMEVSGDRELAFFPGVAVGHSEYEEMPLGFSGEHKRLCSSCAALGTGFDYQSEAGAVAAPITFRKLARPAAPHPPGATPHTPTPTRQGSGEPRAGSPRAVQPAAPGLVPGMDAAACSGPDSPEARSRLTPSDLLLKELDTLVGGEAPRDSGPPQGGGPSLALCPPSAAPPSPGAGTSGDNGVWALSRALAGRCRDYSNGGPVFVSRDTQRARQVQQIRERRQPQAPPPPPQQQQQQRQQQQQQQLTLGGSAGSEGVLPGVTDSAWSSCSSVTVLATYDELGGDAAAVRCEVGNGVAVLVGTHPELGSEFLTPQLPLPQPPPQQEQQQHGAADLTLQTKSASTASLQQHTSLLLSVLLDSQEQRTEYLNALLAACCVAVRVE